MDSFVTALIVLAIVGGGIYFAWWGIQQTLKDDKGRSRRSRRRVRKR